MRAAERRTARIGSPLALAVWLGAGSFAAATTATAPEATGAAHADLSGTWTLNRDLTAELQRDARDQGSGGGFHGGGPGAHHHRGEGGEGGSGGEGRGRGAGDADEERGEGGGRGDRFAALETLVIGETGDSVSIADGAGHRRELHPDGRKDHDTTGPWGAATLRATWDKDGDLLVEIEPEKGPKRTESYVVAHDRKHLYVTVTLAGGFFGGGTQRVRAYDPASAPEASPSPG